MDDNQDLRAILGKNIKFFRFRKNYTQAMLAEKAQISDIFLSHVERGLKFPQPERIVSIAQALDVEVYELFKPQQLPESSTELMNRLTYDIIDKLTFSVNEVMKQYTG